MKILHAAVVSLSLACNVFASGQAPVAAPQGQSRPGAGATANQPQTPSSRTAAMQPVPQGTGQITGRVLSIDGRPLRGARVMVSSTTYRKSWGGRSNADGTYEVTKLPPGEFGVTAYKPGYVSMSYGAKASTGAGRNVRLADGQKVEKTDFQLPRACVISGRVFDEYGEPAGGVTIEVLRSLAIGARRRLMSTDSPERTNDLGQFRVYDMNPGDYYVRATLRAMPLVSEDRFAYPATFYPGVTSAGDATLVPCRAGQETPGIQLSLTRAPAASVSGQILDSQGKPARAGIVLMPPGELTMALNMISTRPDGSFVIPTVTSGAYHVLAMSMPAGPAAPREFATTELTVGDRDITGLALVLGKGATARGRIVADHDAAFDFPLTNVNVFAAMDFDAGLPLPSGSARAKEDGTFEIPGLLGPKRLQVYGFPDTWMLKAVRSKEGDVTEQPIALGAGETVDGLEVVLTNRVTRVTGSVLDDHQRPVKDYAVAIFSDDPAHWGLGTGRVMSVRSDEDGRYTVKGLMPGRYLAIAMAEIDTESLVDSEVLERLRPVATPVTIGEGETKTVELKLRGGQ